MRGCAISFEMKRTSYWKSAWGVMNRCVKIYHLIPYIKSAREVFRYTKVWCQEMLFCFGNKKEKKKKCTPPSINELDGEVLSEYAWNLSHGADTYTPICCPSIDVRPFPAAAIASPFNWSRREHKLPPHWRPPAALLLSWTWSICPRFFSNKDLWTTGICDYSIVQPRMKQL